MSDDTLTVDHQEGQPEGSTPPAGAAPEPESDEVARVSAERDEYLDTPRRVQAEFENFRKRVRREQAARGDTVVEVLRAGYRCRGRLLRPAMVRVGEDPAGASPSEGWSATAAARRP